MTPVTIHTLAHACLTVVWQCPYILGFSWASTARLDKQSTSNVFSKLDLILHLRKCSTMNNLQYTVESISVYFYYKHFWTKLCLFEHVWTMSDCWMVIYTPYIYINKRYTIHMYIHNIYMITSVGRHLNGSRGITHIIYFEAPTKNTHFP